MTSFLRQRFESDRQRLRFMHRALQCACVFLCVYSLLMPMRNRISLVVFTLVSGCVITIAGRKYEFCPTCDSLWLRGWKTPWCRHCQSIVEPQMLQLGQNSFIHLNEQTLCDDSQPVCRVLALLLMVAIRREVNGIRMFTNGRISFERDAKTEEFPSMPVHVVAPVVSVLRAIVGGDAGVSKPTDVTICLNDDQDQPRFVQGTISLPFATDEPQCRIDFEYPVT